MFDDSPTFKRFTGEKPRAIRVHLGYVPELTADDGSEKRGMRIAFAVAVVLHLGFFILQLPEMQSKPLRVGPKKQVYVVQPIKFQPPPPASVEQVPKRKERTKKSPIPDPTPDEPEPIIMEDIYVPEVDLAAVDEAVYGIPEGPFGVGLGGPSPMHVGSGVLPPRKILGPQPLYTEEARQGRIQGVVILEAIIDEDGSVRDVRILKGLPLGLGESAAETAKKWKFQPATLDGKPVAVFFNLTVRFSLQ